MAADSSILIRVAGVGASPEAPEWNFTVSRGEAVWIPQGPDAEESWLDWLTGIELPPKGTVFWKECPWDDRRPAAAAAERGRIGCVFAVVGLIANLDMDENVWLPARVHRWANAAESIEKWARFFGVWPLPAERAPFVRERDRRRILWTRALAGQPEALILEQPLREAPAEDRRLFLEAVCRLRESGSAILWLEAEPAADVRSALAPLTQPRPQLSKGVNHAEEI